MVARAVRHLPNVEADSFEGLLVDYVDRRSAQAIVRGLRAVSDFEFEFQLALMNRKLNERVETIFMMPKDTYTFLSSRIVKEMAQLGGDVSAFVPAHVRTALLGKIQPASRLRRRILCRCSSICATWRRTTSDWKANCPSRSWTLTRATRSSRSANRWNTTWKCRQMEDGLLVQGRLRLLLDCQCVRCLKPFQYRLELDDWTCHLPLEGEECAADGQRLRGLDALSCGKIFCWSFRGIRCAIRSAAGCPETSIGKAKKHRRHRQDRSGFAGLGRVKQTETLIRLNLWVSRSENHREAVNACAALITACWPCRNSAPVRNAPRRTCRTGFAPPAVTTKGARSSPSPPEPDGSQTPRSAFRRVRSLYANRSGCHGWRPRVRGRHRRRQAGAPGRPADHAPCTWSATGREIHAALPQGGFRDHRVRVVHASEVLTMADKPAAALRKKKDCSIVRAVELVHEGKADAVISLGNTGGIFAAATFKLGRIPGVDRGGIAAVIPTPDHAFVLLDAGANIECKPIHLAHYAIMGSIYSREMLGYKNPRVGILSIGTEEGKGNELTLEAFKLCKQLDLNFIGNVEGHDLFRNHVDVVVCDGFVGNIVLKTVREPGHWPCSPCSSAN